jgi:hypothetical protein
MSIAIRAGVTMLVGILTLTGLIPESAAAVVEDNATLVVGGVLTIWGIVAAQRARSEA